MNKLLPIQNEKKVRLELDTDTYEKLENILFYYWRKHTLGTQDYETFEQVISELRNNKVIQSPNTFSGQYCPNHGIPMTKAAKEDQHYCAECNLVYEYNGWSNPPKYYVLNAIEVDKESV